jgi:predicted nucleic acid-binding Zn ribbon protein
MRRNCAKCGTGFDSGRGAPKFCSDGCRFEEITCEGCGEPFTRNNGVKPNQRHCSQRCWVSSYNRRNEDGHSNRGSAVANSTAAERGMARRTTDWYLKRDGEHEHRVVAAAVLGRPLREGEIVHHEDLNKLNNHPHNLIVFASQSEHAKHHGRKHLGRSSCDCDGIRLKEVMPK